MSIIPPSAARKRPVLAPPRLYFHRALHGIDRETVLLSAIVIPIVDEAQPSDIILRPVFDSLWRAGGVLRESPNYDAEERWQHNLG